MNPNFLPPGHLLHHRYSIQSSVGQGGFGITYLAYDQKLDQEVCIKELFVSGNSTRGSNFTVQSQNIGGFSFEEFVQRFVQEARQLAKFQHPNIVRVIDIFQENSTAYMVMEYVKGETLKSKVSREGALGEKGAMSLISQLLDAVEEVHQKGMLHRDIKPDNVLITQEGRLVLIDFGSAREFAEGKTTTQTAMLTPGYAPIEQYSARAQRGPYTDIYALGATMYFLLTGDKPIPATDRVAEELLPPHKLNSRVTSQLSSAVMLAMELKSEHRFQQVSDMREALNMLERRKEKPAKKQEKNTEEGIAPPPPIPKKGIGGKIALAVLLLLFGIGIAYYVKPNLGDGEQTGQTEKEQKEAGRKQQEQEKKEEKKEQTEKEREEALRKQQEEEQRRKQEQELARQQEEQQQKKQQEQQQKEKQEADRIRKQEEQRQREQQEQQQKKQQEQQQKEKQEADRIRKQEEKRQREQKEQEMRRQEQLRNISAVQNLRNDMVLVRGGTFTMGCTSEQGNDCLDNEKPAHQVRLSSFYISKYEVTQALWQEVMGANPSSFKGCDRCPVENVSWNDVQGFIRRLNQISGKNYRLPTEAEWEYAARGGSASRGNKYSGGNNPEEVSWNSANSLRKTHLVGQKRVNELGLYDMSGNVWEWCSDWYAGYSSGSQINPLSPSSGSTRVTRGGGWGSPPRDIRVWIRYGDSPSGHHSHVGFRLALSQ